ncbi:Protein Smaug 1 like [Actinidia chinensis var. chinensis]|uniref:Protein Smaug 1 like n=1 Tax=Actinidia chinensis var. chinensis TaxID=1590841 RepID=A0A2R6R676_ACTCC|nr:Protein Smaug 1 like [Actinidia chinensis var. chinensis]
MAVNSAEEDQDAYSISVLPAEATTDLQCETQLAFLNHSQFPNQLCLDAQLNSYINLEKETADAHSPCILDIYVENGNSGTPKNRDKAVERLKIESPLPRPLQSQISLQIGVKFMKLLMNGTVVLPRFTSRDKSATERSNETPNNRTRKYKRSASFNSRRVVLLFSVVSSVGTLVLIYLTLRVRQIGDGLVYL